MADDFPDIRRVITGLDESRRSAIIEDRPVPFEPNVSRSGVRWLHAWATGPLPVAVDEPDRSPDAGAMMPPSGGSVMTIAEFPPEPKDGAQRVRALAEMRDRIKQAGVQPERGVRRYPDAVHPGMHATDTIDYVIVLSGEIYAVMEGGETLLKAGDLLIQRGTPHAWSNRSNAPCRIAVIQVEAKR